jgi:hypothetical protein
MQINLLIKKQYHNTRSKQNRFFFKSYLKYRYELNIAYNKAK